MCSLPSTRPCTMDFVRAVPKQFVLISDQMGTGKCSGRRHAKREFLNSPCGSMIMSIIVMVL